jgi:hypothetical protein
MPFPSNACSFSVDWSLLCGTQVVGERETGKETTSPSFLQYAAGLHSVSFLHFATRIDELHLGHHHQSQITIMATRLIAHIIFMPFQYFHSIFAIPHFASKLSVNRIASHSVHPVFQKRRLSLKFFLKRQVGVGGRGGSSSEWVQDKGEGKPPS